MRSIALLLLICASACPAEDLGAQARETMAVAHYRMANEQLKKGNWHEAEREYSLALELLPGQPDISASRGELRLHLGNYAGAIEDLTVSLASTPEDAHLRRLRGLSRMRAVPEDIAGACEDFLLAAGELRDVNPNAYCAGQPGWPSVAD